MSKRVILVLCIALLAVSFAAARVVNISVGPSIGFFTGKVPTSENGAEKINYKGLAYGADVAFDLTFGERFELYIQNSFLFNTKNPYFDQPDGWKVLYNPASLDIKSHVGIEIAVLTGPVKLSVGAGASVELISVLLQEKANADHGRFDIILNVGLGATVKAEYKFANNFSAYAKAYIDYFPVTAYGYTAIPAPEGEKPTVFSANCNNFSVDGSIGIIFHF